MRLWDAETGAAIVVLAAYDKYVSSAMFSPNGAWILSWDNDGSAQIVDLARWKIVNGSRELLIAGALARSVGERTFADSDDVLLQDAPIDLFAAALQRLDRQSDDPELQSAIAGMCAPLHDNCYLSPTQMAEKFGSERPKPVDDTTSDSQLFPVAPVAQTGQREGLLRSAVSAEDLTDQQLVEVRAGVPIFRLADGRYHVVFHFAVSSLEEARMAADSLGAVGGGRP